MKRLIFVLILLSLNSPRLLTAQQSSYSSLLSLEKQPNSVATLIDSVVGNDNNKEPTPVFFQSGDTVKTDFDEKFTILFRDGTMVRLMESSSLTINRFFENNPVKRTFEVELYLNEGTAFFLVGENFEEGSVRTQNLTVTNLKSSVFALNFFDLLSSISVTEGNLTVANRLYTKTFKPLQYEENIGFTLPFAEQPVFSGRYIETGSEVYDIILDEEKYFVFGFSGQLITTLTKEIIPDEFRVNFMGDWSLIPSKGNLMLNNRGYIYYEVNLRDFSYEYIKPQKYIFAFLPDTARQAMTPGAVVKYEVTREFPEGYEPDSTSDTEKKTEEELESIKISKIRLLK